jgi:hypothetical protein
MTPDAAPTDDMRNAAGGKDHDSPRVDTTGRFPVIRSPAGAPPITPAMVRRALDED